MAGGTGAVVNTVDTVLHWQPQEQEEPGCVSGGSNGASNGSKQDRRTGGLDVMFFASM